MGRRVYWVPPGPQECEQELHADQDPGTQFCLRQLRRLRPQVHLGSEDTSLITHTDNSTVRAIKLSHLISRSAWNSNLDAFFLS